MNMKKKLFKKFLNFWPPFLGAGIKIEEINPSFTKLTVSMKMRWWNKNYVGTHFGGSLYAMTDPFFMFILMENLGSDYIVWDKAANIKFKKPGHGKVMAQFEISPEVIAEIKAKADVEYKVEPIFHTMIKDINGVVIAEVEKLLYVKKKK